jgi:hypothetical protein
MYVKLLILQSKRVSNFGNFGNSVKLFLEHDNFFSVSGRTITVSLVDVGNTFDNQNAMGTDQWIGHAYNWIEVPPSPGEFTLPPGVTSPLTPDSSFPFSSDNYLGYYNVGTESITENFGGNTACFPVISNGVVRASVSTTIFAIRYKMRSTRPAGCYMARFRGDEGIRLYVDNQLVFIDDIPNNLMPFILKVATKEYNKLNIYGNDYDTHDGTCIRDFIHVVDLATAHVKSLELSTNNKLEIFNIGTGKGTSVLELGKNF